MFKKLTMKHFRKPVILIFSVLLFMPFTGISQNKLLDDSSDNKLIYAAKEIITSASTCALITLDDEGRPRVRQMDAFPPEDDFTIWFGTNPKSRKVNQIKNDSRVTLYYLDSDDTGYVMIHGKAQLVHDLWEKEKHWKSDWEAFYPDYPNDFLLIKVSPDWMEVVSYVYGITGDPDTWEPQQVKFNSK
jgi:general stress protein 26